MIPREVLGLNPDDPKNEFGAFCPSESKPDGAMLTPSGLLALEGNILAFFIIESGKTDLPKASKTA